MKVSRRNVVLSLVLLATLVGAATAAAVPWMRHRDEAALRSAVRAFATAWQEDRLDQAPLTGVAPAEVSSRTKKITDGLTPARGDHPSEVTVVSARRKDPGTGTASLRVGWTLEGARRWSYDTTAPLVKQEGRWKVAWRPSVVHPSVTDDAVLRTSRTAAQRGQILAGDGKTIVQQRPVVHVGIHPGRADDPRASARAVASVVDVDASALADRVAKAPPDSFVDVITLRRGAYDRVRDRLQPIPGAVFREAELPLAPTAEFARAVLGTVGPATKEIVESSRGRVTATDTTGLAGVQRAYDELLAGKAGLEVRLVSAPGTATGPDGTAAGDAGAGTADVQTETLYAIPPSAGSDVRLTLDVRTQRAAEYALATARKPAALVAIRAGTGEVLAVANGGPAASGYNRALLGRYPPGSTFKVASTYALLRDGLDADTTVRCPPSFSVNGKVFVNAEGEVLGSVPFRSDFAHSCNTAFVASAARISPTQLRDAARDLGFGSAGAALGLAAFDGDVPATDDPVEHAADAIGQGKVLASPLTVAAVSASVAAGRFTPPRLVTEPRPTGDVPDPVELDPAAVRTLRTLMREVVTDGTGTALRSVPGGPVHGKTGTAEYGSGDPPPTHAWFTGYQGDVAFAVVVEDGGFGAQTAAPLAARFLTKLA